MSKPIISVLMSCFNSQDSVGESINSILNQSFKNFELLVFNDGSIDKTLNCITKFKDERIKILNSNINLGLTKRLNELANIATGTYLARQDADDVSVLNRLEVQYEFLQKNKDYSGVTSRTYINKSKKIKPRYSYKLPKQFVLLLKNPFIHGTLMIDKNIFHSVGGYNNYYFYSQDYKLFLDLYKNNYKIKILSEPLYFLNTLDNISSNFHSEQNSYKRKAIKSYMFDKIN